MKKQEATESALEKSCLHHLREELNEENLLVIGGFFLIK